MGYLIRQAKYRAKIEGKEFSIRKEDLLPIPTHCPILGIELYFSEGKRTNNSYSVDRIDNTKGYVKGNVAIISWDANRRKGNLGLNAIENLYKYSRGLL